MEHNEAGHVMYPDERTYELFKHALTDIQPAVRGQDQSSGETLHGVHPVYGRVAMSRVPEAVGRTSQPSFVIIISTDDEALAARARSELDKDEVP